MSILRYQPWPAASLFNQLRPSTAAGAVPAAGTPDEERSGWSPAVDIAVDDNAYMIAADVPGVSPSDIEVTVERGVLTIKGERQIETSGQDQNTELRRAERTRGTFERRFTLPEDADGDTIEATGKDGVLTVRVPKKASEAVRRIAVAA